MIRPIQVVVAAPHPVMLAGLRSLLDGHREVAILAACSTYASTIRALRQHKPPVLIADAAICNAADAEAVEQLQAVCVDGTRLAVIAQQALIQESSLDRPALTVILPRDVGPARLVECVKALADGRPCVKPGARTAGVPPTRGSSPLGVLTARERQVAQEAARGKRNKEIAAALGITPGTVKLHLHRVYGKLRVDNRLALFKKLTDGAQGSGER